MSRSPYVDESSWREAVKSRIQPGRPEECWLWAGHVGTDGYGRLKRFGRYIKAHRAVYELFVGAIPKGMVIRHRCDNPACVNPAHLLVGTQAQNANDMAVRGRSIKGRRFTTECPQGHAYTDENSYYDKRNRRMRRTCHRDRTRARRASRKATA